MRRKMIIKGFCTLCMTAAMLISSVGTCYASPDDTQDMVEDVENIIEITDVDSFLEFAKNCSYDLWSINKTVCLQSDIDLSGVSFEGIPYFNGVFEGNGHTISGLYMQVKGSDYGLFRYIGELGQVKDLKVTGSMAPTGSQEYIGGIVGVNYGIVENCSFEGSVSGLNAVGAIAGVNKPTGKIIDCNSKALILATNCTGGIAGRNDGLISGCVSKSSINIEELETTLDMGGMIDLGTLNSVDTVITRNDMGGIAGNSTGIITGCKNEGIVGYNHTGYNVGGIAGSQSGIILFSENTGEIYGRKDVGGIVGQAIPYVESEYLEDKAEQTRNDINRLSNTVNNISTTMKSSSEEINQYAESLNTQYKASMNNISDNLDELADSVPGDNPEAQGYVNNINSAMDRIESLQSKGDSLTEEELDEIQDNLGIINDNLGNLQNSYEGSDASTEELVNQMSSEINKEDNSGQDIKDLANTLDANMLSITNNINSATNQINQIADSVSEDFEIIMEEEVITDISSIATAEEMNGVISGCTNRGKVNGDLNVGGIAGTMNLEYESDPEMDVDLSEDTSVRLRSTVNDVMIHCLNYGQILAKKNFAGGIVGLQELGLVYDCQGYGDVSSDAGNYIGGIAGTSKGTVQSSYTLCNVTGTDYVGGISGSAYTLVNNISISGIDADGERIGSIAGMVSEEGEVTGNYYVSDTLYGIDNISYAGVAEPKTYEEIMEMELIPAGFKTVTVVFEIEDEVLAEKTIAYGRGLIDADFPDVEEKEGYYVEWPDIKEVAEVSNNMHIVAEYVAWTESVAGDVKAESGKNILLAVGEFYGDTTITMNEVAGPDSLPENATIAYAYSWNLKSNTEKEFDSVEGHFRIPKTEEELQLWMEIDGSWTMVETIEDGSYLVAELPCDASFAMVTVPQSYTQYYIIAGICGIAIFLILVIVVIRVRKKRKSIRKGK